MKRIFIFILFISLICLVCACSRDADADDTSVPVTRIDGASDTIPDETYSFSSDMPDSDPAEPESGIVTESPETEAEETDTQSLSGETETSPQTVPVPTELSMFYDNISVGLYSTEILLCIITPAEAYDTELVWSSSDEKTVKVDDEGNIEALAMGEAIITVSAPAYGLSASCVVTVGYPTPGLPDEKSWLYELKNGEAVITGYLYFNYSMYLPDNAEIVIPDTIAGYPVTAIGKGAFAGVGSGASLILSEGITSIGDEAFRDSKLESLSIPGTVTKIGKRAFSGCSALKTFKLDSVGAVLEESAFEYCPQLESVVLGGVTELPESCFKNCYKLTVVSLPDGMARIGADAFYGCSSLNALKLPASLESIGEKAFAECISLGSVTLPDSLTELGTYVFSGCINIESVMFGSALNVIPEGAFAGCTSLASLDIPGSIRELCSNAFAGCLKLAVVYIEDGVTDIDAGCFKSIYTCDIFLPQTVSYIGDEAFELSGGIVIHGIAGSFAEEYANSNSLVFEIEG